MFTTINTLENICENTIIKHQSLSISFAVVTILIVVFSGLIRLGGGTELIKLFDRVTLMNKPRLELFAQRICKTKCVDQLRY